jgi:outer membrane protein OmpA-like peptidoglycan-associated protein
LDIDEFEFNKTTIPSKHIPSLTALRTRLAAEPGATVVCTGNTDTVGNETYNYKLGMERAAAVRDFLIAEKSVDAKRIKIDSKGEEDPAKGEPPAKPDPDPGQRDPKNRRVEVVATFPAVKPKPKGGEEPKGKVNYKGKR